MRDCRDESPDNIPSQKYRHKDMFPTDQEVIDAMDFIAGTRSGVTQMKETRAKKKADDGRKCKYHHRCELNRPDSTMVEYRKKSSKFHTPKKSRSQLPIQHIEIVFSPIEGNGSGVEASQLLFMGEDGSDLKVRKPRTTPKKKRSRSSLAKNRRKDIFTTGKKTQRKIKQRVKSPIHHRSRSKTKKTKKIKNLKKPHSSRKSKKKVKFRNKPTSVTMKSYGKVNYDEIFGDDKVLGTLDYGYTEEDTPAFNLS